jgi:hypothetical protein
MVPAHALLWRPEGFEPATGVRPRPEWAATGRWAERIATVSGAWDRSADGATALTYFTVIQATTMISRLQLRLALALSASFVHVLARLNDPRAKDEAERLKESTEQVSATNVRYYINAVFASIVCLIVILRLISTVLSG